MALLGQDCIELATKRLTDLGYIVTFGKNVMKSDEVISSSIEDRISDFHEAFLDKNIAQ